MTDYMQKARDVAYKAYQYDLEASICAHAEALESLDTERTRADKAEQRERELREAVAELLKYEGHHVYCGHAPDYDKPCVCGLNNAQAKARTLMQPEPDPLVELLRGEGFAEAVISSLVPPLRTALAKHGLSIVKGES